MSAVFNCDGCRFFRATSYSSNKFCHYALKTERCRIINGKIVPAKKCYTKKIFFEEKELV